MGGRRVAEQGGGATKSSALIEMGERMGFSSTNTFSTTIGSSAWVIASGYLPAL
jgi:hypothetical protein